VGLQALVRSLQQKGRGSRRKETHVEPLWFVEQAGRPQRSKWPQGLQDVPRAPPRVAGHARRFHRNSLTMGAANQAVCPAYAKIRRGLLGIGSRISPSTFAASPARHRSGCAPATAGSLESVGAVGPRAGCRDEYIDLMAGVSQIVDDPAASHLSAALGQKETYAASKGRSN
jgi:hypothetical protein